MGQSAGTNRGFSDLRDDQEYVACALMMGAHPTSSVAPSENGRELQLSLMTTFLAPKNVCRCYHFLVANQHISGRNVRYLRNTTMYQLGYLGGTVMPCQVKEYQHIRAKVCHLVHTMTASPSHASLASNTSPPLASSIGHRGDIQGFWRH